MEQDIESRLKQLEKTVEEQSKILKTYDIKIFKMNSRINHLEDQVGRLKSKGM